MHAQIKKIVPRILTGYNDSYDRFSIMRLTLKALYEMERST